MIQKSIHNHFKGRSSKPFMFANVEGSKPFGIRRFDKTEEFGGGVVREKK